MDGDAKEVARLWQMMEADALHRAAVKAEMEALYARLAVLVPKP